MQFNRNFGERLILAAATGFGSGLTPLGPGTAGTIAAVPLYLALSQLGGPLYGVVTCVLTIPAVWISGKAEILFGRKDDQRIVIDEICGFLFTMAFVTSSISRVILGFVLFRIFDIVKPFPCRWCQNRLPGGYGVVGDDIVAGIYGNLILHALIRFMGV